MIDIDEFKSAPHPHGHGVGDADLISIVQAAMQFTGKKDIFSGCAGEKYAPFSRRIFAISITFASSLKEPDCWLATSWPRQKNLM